MEANAKRERARSGMGAVLARHERAAVWILVAAFAAIYGAVCAIKYRYYLYNDFDLAIFAQALDRALGGSFHNSIRGMNWLGDHSSLNLFLLLPVYAVLRHPLTLLFAQAIGLALGAVAVHRLARDEGLDAGLAVACAALYLLQPALGYTALYEFHPETLATAPLLFAFLAWRTGRTRALIVWTTLALLAKEDVALVVGAFAIVALLRRSDPLRLRHAAVLAALALVSVLVTFLALKPLNAGQAEYGRMYTQWGETTGSVVSNMVMHPWRVVEQLAATPGDPTDSALKREYWLHVLLPVSFLPLLSPITLLIAFPVIVAHLLSWRLQQHVIVFQYTALVTPFVVAAAVLGLARLLRWVARSRSRKPRGRGASEAVAPARAPAIGVALLAVAIVCQAMFGPIASFRTPQTMKPRQANFPSGVDRALRAVRDEMVARVPARGTVVAGFEYLSHLVRGRDVHSLHHLLQGTYTFSTRPYPIPDGVVALLADEGPIGMAFATPGSGERLRELVARNHLAPVAAEADVQLFLRDAPAGVVLAEPAGREPGQAHHVRFDGVIDFLGNDAPRTDGVPGAPLAVATYWRRTGPVNRTYTVSLFLLGTNGKTTELRTHALGGLLEPASDWPDSTTVRDIARTILPAGLKPGNYLLAYYLTWRAGGRQSGVAVTEDPDAQAAGGAVELGTIVITRPGEPRP